MSYVNLQGFGDVEISEGTMGQQLKFRTNAVLVVLNDCSLCRTLWHTREEGVEWDQPHNHACCGKLLHELTKVTMMSAS